MKYFILPLQCVHACFPTIIPAPAHTFNNEIKKKLDTFL